MPSSPCSPSAGHRSRGNSLRRSMSAARGAMRSVAKRRTCWRISSSSAPRPKSLSVQSSVLMGLPSPWIESYDCRTNRQPWQVPHAPHLHSGRSQVAREFVAAVDVGGPRGDALGGEAPHLLADLLELGAQAEVAVGAVERAHGLAFSLDRIV